MALPLAEGLAIFPGSWFESGGFQPHGYCYQWNAGLVWLNVIGDGLIALAYFTIPVVLWWFIRHRRDLPFSWMFGLFGTFIVACGMTHAMEIWNLWYAQYWLAGVVKLITAAASVSTAILLIRLMPQALEIPNSNQWIRANANLTEANKELESFSYSVSHDLRAPLRTIDGFSHALLEDCFDRLDETGKDYLNRIRAATQRMDSLIDDLLSLSQVTRTEIHEKTLDISALARAIGKELQAAHSERTIELRIENGLRTTADPGLIRIVLENLLSNAWKFTSKQSSARIEFGKIRLKGALAYFVRDDGAGFNPEYADRLFGPFQRLHSVAEFPGSGIGLATVQRIVQRHGGRVWAESTVGQGATFYFTLPQVPSRGGAWRKTG